MSELSFNNKLEIFFLTSLIFFITLKPLFSSDDWAIPNLPGYVYLFQNISQYISFVSLLILFFIMIIFLKSKKINLSISCFLFAIVLIWYATRSYFVGSQDFKSLISILFILISVTYFSTFSTNERKLIPYHSILIAMSCWTILNIFLFLSSYGYALIGTGTRFFGSSPHPNFTGAYAVLAVCIFLSIYLKQNNASLYKNFILLLLTCSVFLVFISGSRTALLALILTFFILIPNFYKIIPFILGILFYFIFFYLYVDNAIYAAFERMKNAPLDNRNEVWESLINDFSQNPLIGSGDLSGVSGSGYLTTLGGTGLIGSVFFVIALAISLYYFVININRVNNENNVMYYMIFLAICFMSLTEGYIFDKMGIFQVFLLLVSAMFGPFISKKMIWR